jgi:hypothetical protein
VSYLPGTLRGLTTELERIVYSVLTSKAQENKPYNFSMTLHLINYQTQFNDSVLRYINCIALKKIKYEKRWLPILVNFHKFEKEDFDFPH